MFCFLWIFFFFKTIWTGIFQENYFGFWLFFILRFSFQIIFYWFFLLKFCRFFTVFHIFNIYMNIYVEYSYCVIYSTFIYSLMIIFVLFMKFICKSTIWTIFYFAFLSIHHVINKNLSLSILFWINFYSFTNLIR